MSREPIAVRLKDGQPALDRRSVMAQVIEFYVPASYKPKVKWIPPERRGKVIEFRADLKKSA
jgi:hypothetical protein